MVRSKKIATAWPAAIRDSARKWPPAWRAAPGSSPATSLGGDAELPGASSGIANCQHPDAVAFTSPTLRTTLAMKDLPVQQRTPQDLGGFREPPDELIARFNSFFAFHLDT